jgi:predicted dehydrogenase
MHANRSRRDVLKSTGAAVLSPLLTTAVFAAGKPTQRLRVGVIGIGVRGKFLIANLPTELQVTALCDCSLDQIDTAIKPTGRFAGILAEFSATDAAGAKVYQDYRVMLKQQEFDAVIIAAPDHHHASAAILAMQAGADVYVEKPLAVTIAEGRAIADAARQYNRVVQVGSQQRTMQVNRRACQFIRDGGLGKVVRVEEKNYPGPMPYVPDAFPRQPIPERLDWNLFCGATDLRDYNEKLWVKDAFDYGYLLWRGWDLFRDYSGHLMTNWGAHSVDMIQFALGKDTTGPTEVMPLVDQLDPLVDDQWHHKTPPLGSLKNRQDDKMRFCPVTMKYADGTVLEFKPGIRQTVFHGEKGRLWLSRNDYRTEPHDLLAPPSEKEKARWSGDGHVARPHLQNWLDAIQQRAAVHAPVETGHRSITVCHLANIARELGRNLAWDPERERFDDVQANARLSRTRRRGFELP